MFNTWLNLNPGRFVPLFRRVKSKYQGYKIVKSGPWASTLYTKHIDPSVFVSTEYIRSWYWGIPKGPFANDTSSATINLPVTQFPILSSTYESMFTEV